MYVVYDLGMRMNTIWEPKRLAIEGIIWYSRMSRHGDLEDLQNQIDEWHDTVREMEIDLRELIHEAIMDREELNRRMLEGRIDMENE